MAQKRPSDPHGPRRLPPAERARLLELATLMVAMKDAGLSHDLIVDAAELARTDPSVQGIMRAWRATDPAVERGERAAILANLRLSIREAASGRPAERYEVRSRIDQRGGITAVARAAGIPQPSLTRMLASPSTPRGATLAKIAAALDFTVDDLHRAWTR